MATKKKLTPRLTASPRSVLPGSDKAPFSHTTGEQPAPSSKKITVTVIVKRKTPLKAANCTGKERLTRAQYRQRHGADPNAIKLVRAFAKEYGLAVAADSASLDRKSVV